MSLSPYEVLVDQGLRTLRSLQQEDGSFLSTKIPEGTTERTTFFTSLILLALREIPNTQIKQEIVTAGLEFLKQQCSQNLTVNYHPRNHVTHYPDDLDDTFQALRCIRFYDLEYITEERLVIIVKNLIAQEVAPGGPYYTWIVDPNHRDAWDTIDSVVMSAIGAFLNNYDIVLPPLEQAIERDIITHDIRSDFYHRSIIKNYFITQYYRGPAVHKLHEEIFLEQQGAWFGNTILETALAVTTLIRLGTQPELFKESYSLLEAGLREPLASPVFIEKIHNETISYAGCSAFTLVSILEAITLWNQAETKDSVVCEESEQTLKDDFCHHVFERCIERLSEFPEIAPSFSKKLLAFGKEDASHIVTLLPYVMNQNLIHEEHRLPLEKLSVMSEALVIGWIGYTLLDDLFDHEQADEDVALAVMCIQECHELFVDITETEPLLREVFMILKTMVHRNAWEIRHARAEVTHTILMIPETLPDYTSLESISEKSFGYALGALCLLGRIHALPLQDYRACKDFFTYLLTIRQLNDDLHDWYEDMTHGILNPVGTRVIEEFLKQYPFKKHLALKRNYTILHTLFWDEIFPWFTEQMTGMIDNARRSLETISVLHTENILKQLIDREATTLDKIVSERNKMKKFMDAYTKDL